MSDNNAILKAALSYAAQGFKVFPLKSGCKIPITSHGVKDATQLQDTIKKYWRKYPNANIGLSCDGLLVLDFDGKAGAESKTRLITKYGKLPQTWVIKTGGGTQAEPKEQGEHYVYRVPTDLNIRPGAGKYGFQNLDIRANDSYIVAVPSVTRLPYESIDNSPVADAPEWLIELARDKHDGSKSVSRPVTELKKGQRHTDLISFIGKWRNRGFTENEIEVQALALNATSEKPLPETEILEMCSQYSTPETPAKLKTFDWHDYAVTHTDLLSKKLQPISFLVEDILIDTGTGILAGRKKLGKSFLATQLSQSIGSGADFLGHRVKQGSVVHFALEDGERRTQSRLRMQKTTGDLPITYFYKWPAWNTPAGFTQLRAMLIELKPSLVVVDTFAKILNGKPEQNSAGDMGDFGNRMHDLALELNLMILFIAHHGKGLQMTHRDPGFDIRGSSAIPGATDVNIGLYRNEDTTYELIGEGRDIPEFDFRVSFDKEATWVWQLEGEAQDLRRHEAEVKIIEALELLGVADAQAIADQADTTRANANMHLKRMREYENAPVCYEVVGKKIMYSLTTLTGLTDKNNLQHLHESIVSDTVSEKSRACSKLSESVVSDLLDCPACGRNEWTYSPDGKLLCPCGYKQGGE